MHINYFDVNKDGLTIRGIITKPDGKGPYPAVVYNHGFTGHKAESHFLFKKLSDSLANMGIVSIRFDFIGSGESDGKFQEMTMSSEVEDCLAVFHFAKEIDYIDSNRMNLIGFSMGGAVSIIASSALKEQVKKLILLCPAVNIFNVVTRNVKNEALFKYIEEGVIDFGGNLVGKELVDDVFHQNVYEEAKQVTANVQLIHGTNDDTVPPIVSLQLSKIFGDQSTLNWIHGSDHCYSSLDYETQVIDLVKSFMKDL
ncbi:alpha/beta hydrolase family protein [Heyndrickxia sp. NPDC080065]|uniref:alpha/beta hydrolase family protein n=1 Tax=Heyndrickxia sp. NPDC080065 TaxID=3390568 RepID=UPI003D08E792